MVDHLFRKLKPSIDMNATILPLTERVKNTIALGESHFREFKSAHYGPPSDKKPRPAKDICRDIAEALVSFANADGGELLVGVEDDGTVSGVPHGGADLELMRNATITHVHAESNLPITHVDCLTVNGKTVLFFAVTKGTTRIYQLSDGRCVRRREQCTEPADVHQLLFARQEAESRAYDQEFVDGASVNDLDVALVQSVGQSFLTGVGVEYFLQQVGLAEYAAGGLRLRRAALLLFAKDISRWHSKSQVRILKVAGNELRTGEQYNVSADETTEGNIFQLLQNSWERLRLLIAYKTDFGHDARFEQRYLYPEWACREALINAVAHRAYNNSRGVEIFMFDDRMEIKSPGALLSTLTLEGLRKLSGGHESRNTLVARVLRENKVMRELGEGIKRIFKLMEENELLAPTILSDESWFTISFPHKAIYTKEQEEWLKLFSACRLTGLQKRVVLLGMGGREISRQDIVRALSTRDRDTYDGAITPLRHQGVLIEIRTQAAATAIARKEGILRDVVTRWKVAVPTAGALISQDVGREVPSAEKADAVQPQQSCPIHLSTRQARRRVIDDECKVFFRFRPSPQPVTREEVVRHFGRCGRVKHIELPRIAGSDVQKGFGFVWYDSREAAEGAIRTLNGSSMGKRNITVESALPRD